MSFTKLRNYLTRRNIIIAVSLLVILIVGSAIWRMASSDAVPESARGLREVTVSSVADLMSGGGSLSVVAEVQSVNEAKISAEGSGRVARVHAELGERVSAGQVLAEIENASERALVLQAEGVLDAAKAAAGGSRGSALATVLGAYASVDNAINDAVNQINTDPADSSPTFSVSTRNTLALAEMENLRPKMDVILERHSSKASTLTTSSDFSAELKLLEDELLQVNSYLDTVLQVLNSGVVRPDISAATISAYVADVSSARSAVTASLSAVIAARTTLDPQGAVSASSASVKQAQGAYNAALANLEKTIIRSPIFGTLNHFTIKLGDTVAALQQVAIVSNNGALEAVMYVTESNRNRLKVGQKVSIEGASATITKIAPALDPVTGRIEVRVGLPANLSFTNGEAVRVELAKSDTPVTAVEGPITIPITAIKIEADRTIVFTVSDGKLAIKEVKIGKLSGESVQVNEGLTLDDEIVVDARGLKDGQEVVVASQMN